ncbi:MAG TPA: hypothetical protein VHW93_04580 [Acidimicrobiales bacterium]|jgi:acyl-CoA synthetase (AMP-forming)/AMP-acid ligase II|nr:hypothetical protein [Acidimicrobiales bacterium]
MIVSGGDNIASSEIERVLYEHEAVLEAVVAAPPGIVTYNDLPLVLPRGTVPTA